MVKPNRKFDLEVEDIEAIENCLHREVNRLSHQRLVRIELLEGSTDLEPIEEIDRDIKKLHEILGKLHTQKVWYRPPKRYVSG